MLKVDDHVQPTIDDRFAILIRQANSKPFANVIFDDQTTASEALSKLKEIVSSCRDIQLH